MLTLLEPRPMTAGLGYSHSWPPDIPPGPHDAALDVLLNDKGVAGPV